MNRATKTMIIDMYTTILRENGYIERDEDAVNEARWFEKKENGGKSLDQVLTSGQILIRYQQPLTSGYILVNIIHYINADINADFEFLYDSYLVVSQYTWWSHSPGGVDGKAAVHSFEKFQAAFAR